MHYVTGLQMRTRLLTVAAAVACVAGCAPASPLPTLAVTAPPTATHPPTPTPLSATQAPTATAAASPATTQPAPGDGPAYDLRSDPIAVLTSYVDAINRRDFRRAYDFWENPPNGQTFEQFEQGFSETVSTHLIVGPPPRLEGAAGSVYTSIPTVLRAVHTDANQQLFVGCVVARRDNASGSNPEQNPWRLSDATLQTVPLDSDVMALLAEACPAA